MIAPLFQSRTHHVFYHINENLEIANYPEVAENEVILYVNYFGIKTNYAANLVQRYGKSLVLDNSQAFFAPPITGVPCIYSPRKFVGVPDGGLLHGMSEASVPLERDTSVDSVSHLVGRLDSNAAQFYSEYRRSEDSLADRPMRGMSGFTKKVLFSLDYEHIRAIREKNFWYVHAHLAVENRLTIESSTICGPMIYPFLTNSGGVRDCLIQNHIYVASYWPDVLQNPNRSMMDVKITNELLPLPIDQRYTADDMARMLEIML